MIAGGFLPVADGFLPSSRRGGFVPPLSLGAQWTVDAASGKGVPANAAEWTAAMNAAGISTGNPSSLWLCQEASGNLADSIGAISLTASGTPNYQQNVTGWSRKAIVMDDNTTDGFTSISIALPLLLTDSHLLLGYIRMPAAAPASARNLMTVGGVGTTFTSTITNTPRLRATHGANTADSTASPCDGNVHPFILRHRVSGEADVMTDAEKVSPTFSALVAGQRILVAASAAAAFGLLYLASFHVGAADLTDAQIKTLLQTLGWSVAWS